ncbi:hypothetical protein SETIT_8G189200v2 [Setaria italica]|uniref:Uncharacterized protein n=1 Tax=Setaria italica TaxID=4555 RepID=A0A368SB10_SETIT|nr:hypothetical protein SETIT_8G189200v2 [Setaria italica]
MAGGGRGPRRRNWICRCCGGSKLGGRARGNDDIVVKLGSRNRGEWICVRGHPVRWVGCMCVDANGDVYIPDSEDEESGMEMEWGAKEVADLGAASVTTGGVQMADGVVGDGIDVAAESVAMDAVEVAAKGGAADGVELPVDSATAEEMHPELTARLKMLLAHMDPIFHDVFVSMYKVMEPAFFNL